MLITSIYSSLLAFVFVYLSVRTLRLRRRLRIGIGDGGNQQMLRAMTFTSILSSACYLLISAILR